MTDLRTVQLPEDLCSAVERSLGPRFGTLEEVLTAVMRDLVNDQAIILDRTEEQLIDQRLRELGYL